MIAPLFCYNLSKNSLILSSPPLTTFNKGQFKRVDFWTIRHICSVKMGDAKLNNSIYH